MIKKKPKVETFEGVVELQDGSLKGIRATKQDVDFAKELAKQEVLGKRPNITKAYRLCSDNEGLTPTQVYNKASRAYKDNVIALKDNMVRCYQEALLAEISVDEYAREVVSSFKEEKGSRKVPGLNLLAEIMEIKKGKGSSDSGIEKHVQNILNFYN